MHLHVKTLNRNDRKKRMHAFIPNRRTGGGTTTDGRFISSHVSRSRGGMDRFTGSSGPLHTWAHLVVHSPARCARMIACRGRRYSVCRLGQVFNDHVIASSCVHHPAEWTTRSYNVERHCDRALLFPNFLFYFRVMMSSLRRSINTDQRKSEYPVREKLSNCNRQYVIKVKVIYIKKKMAFSKRLSLFKLLF